MIGKLIAIKVWLNDLDSKAGIFKFLEQQVTEDDVPKMRECLDSMSPKDLKHIDYLIFLMSQYPTAAPHLLQSIFEILREDETHLNALMSNFLWINLELVYTKAELFPIVKAIISANWSNNLKMLFILICHGWGETTQIRKSGLSSVLYIDGLFKFKPCLLEHSQIQKCDFIRGK